MNNLISSLKPTKHLNSKELQTILPDMNVMGLAGNRTMCSGPSILIGDILYYAETYSFNTIKDIQAYFAPKYQETLLVYDYDSPSLINQNVIGVKLGDKITVELSNMSKCNFVDNFEVDCECELIVNFLNEDVDRCYSSYTFRIYTKTKQKSDNFEECDSTECVIKSVEENIENIIKKK